MKFAIGTTYYNCPDLLNDFLISHKKLSAEIIVVDDGSTKYPAEPIVRSHNELKNIKLFVVEKDYGFNSHGCRNLIMNQAKNDWVLLIDLDRYISRPKNFVSSLPINIDKNSMYKFTVSLGQSSRYHKMSEHESMNDFLIHKQLFFKVGGYDEEYVGYRRGDREFISQIEKVGSINWLKHIRVVYTRLPTVHLRDNKLTLSPKDKLLVDSKCTKIMRLVKQRIDNPSPDKPILQFDWHQVI